jgi:hypothetical protein
LANRSPDGKRTAPQVSRRETCKGVCPPTTRTHDLPDPTSDEPRPDGADSPKRRPDLAGPAFTTPAAGPEPPEEPTTD